MFNKNSVFPFVVMMTIFGFVENYRILGIFPMSAPSHFFLGSSLMKALAEAGHDVTIIAPYEEKELPSLSRNGSYREIILTGLQPLQLRMTKDGKFDMQNLRKEMKDVVNALNMLGRSLTVVVEDVINHPNVKKLLESGEKFDVVILSEFMNRLLRAFAKHFDASLILFANSGLMTWYNDEIGKIILPSVGPVGIEMPFRMTLSQRLYNTIDKIKSFNWFLNYAKQQNELMHKYFPNIPSLDEISKNISLVLVNSHPSTETPQQLLPNIINIGGFHVKPPKNLPEDLQEVMDNAKDGVILFSFGTIVDPTLIPSEKLQDILHMLGKRKETILWKFGGELLGIPKNVIIRKWLPQQDVLAHPNVKLFITHSGYLSTIESTYHGIPTVLVPFGADQIQNAKFVEETGSGVMISSENINGETLEKAIVEVIENPRYLEAAKEKSRIMRDRPNKPVDEAIFWVEYIVRHKGAKHLRVPYLDMPLYQVYMVDVIGVIFSVSIVILLLFVLITIKLFNCITKTGNKKKSEHDKCIKKNK